MLNPASAHKREIFDFRWWVPKDGWQWVAGKEVAGGQGQEKMFLFPGSPLEGGWYDPLNENPALYREFVEIEATPEGILRFANQWGRLETHGVDFRPKDEVKFPPPNPVDPFSRDYVGETVENWKHHISLLRGQIQLWDMIQAGDIKGIKEHTFTLKAARLDEHAPVEEIRNVGLEALRGTVNAALYQWVQAGLLFNEDKSGLSIYVVPHDLRSAFWLQFARAIEGDIRYARCVECSRWMEIAIGSGRPDKKYCSSACRMRSYRKRRAAR